MKFRHKDGVAVAAARAGFAPDPAALPDVVVELVPLTAYDALLGEVAA